MMTSARRAPLLEVRDLHAGYGEGRVLRGLSLSIDDGEIVGLLGRNGAGRSTLARAIMGLLPTQIAMPGAMRGRGQGAVLGSIRLRGVELLGLRPYQIARAGIGYVPEDREVFPELTVEQNLLLGSKAGAGITAQPPWRSEDMYALFPRLGERRRTVAGVLSGGEQQMLTLCRTLMGNPGVMIIDEPTEGLAPKLVEQLAAFIVTLRERGLAVLLIEQKLTIALDISSRIYVMGQGRTVFEGHPTALAAASSVRRAWLEVP